MCAICGVVQPGTSAPIDAETVRRMRDTMVHRGPDDEGLFVSGDVAIGHRRLAIIDLASGHQPMASDDGSVWITYNGEVYNFRELRARLEARGHVFRTKSDTEVILHAYEAYGESCVDHLRGMFAFAIWDGRKRQLLLARDRLGVKPLYYAWHGEAFLFASEVKAILQWPGFPREVDPHALWDYLGYRYVPGPRTLFRSVLKLPPGHLLVLRDGTATVRRYWDVPLDAEPPAEGDLVARFLELLSESVRLRLVSDVPLGVFLSGGLDSSTITALVAGMTGEPVQTFCVGYPDGAADERPWARLVARRFATEHRDLVVEPEAFWRFLPRMVWFLDEPVADPPACSLFFLARFARQFVTVVLSGEGGDEIQAGYAIYRTMLRLRWLRRLSVLRRVAPLFSGHRAQRYAERLGRDLEDCYRGVSSSFTALERARLLQGGAAPEDDVARTCFERTRGLPPLQRMLYFDLKVWLPDDLLVKADKMTMAASVELRVPFLDHRLVEWAWTLPPSLKLNGSTGKYLLRRAARRVLPAAIVERPKFGFAVPVGQWLRGMLGASARRLLVEEGSLDDVVDRREVTRLLARHETGAEDLTDQLYTLVVLGWWYRIFIRSSGPPGLEERPVTAEAEARVWR